MFWEDALEMCKGLDTTRELTDSLQCLIDAYAYNAYGEDLGELRAPSDPAKPVNPLRYVGKEGYYTDTDTGLMLLGARYYDPLIGRFITQDPDRDGLNWYQYAGNNPVNKVDPTGVIPSPMEAAQMAKDIYKVGSVKLSGGWGYRYSIRDGEGMVMGVYRRTRASSGPADRYEYVLASKGTTPTNLNDWKNNVEELSTDFSEDMSASLEHAKKFLKDYPNKEVTMVGHSKGGLEAAANAILTGKNCIVFNPAKANLYQYNGVSPGDYTGRMTAYVVTGEILNGLQGSWPYSETVFLPQQHGLFSPVDNHSMNAVNKCAERRRVLEDYEF